VDAAPRSGEIYAGISMTPERDEALRSLAYELWVARGKPNGSPEVDWVEAERLLSARGFAEETQVLVASLDKSAAGSDGAFSDRKSARDAVKDDEDTVINPSIPRSQPQQRPRKR
jgi:DUF2934 family protein